MPSSGPWAAFAVVALAGAACSRAAPPPPGSGAVETSPLGSAGPQDRASPRGSGFARAIAGLPGGAALVADRSACTLTRLDADQGLAWRRALPDCGGRIEVAVGDGDEAYTRTAAFLQAWSPAGEERWRVAAGAEAVPDAALTPAVSRQGFVVSVRSGRLVVAHKRADGAELWRFTVPQDELIEAAPVAGRADETLLLTTRAVYVLTAAGAARARRVDPG